MKQYNLLPALLLISFLTACGNGMEEGSAKTPAPITLQPAKQQQTAPAAATTASLNPAHGQPGHRCDIQVGAPLNSAPTQPTIITPSQQPTVVTPQATTIPVTGTAAGGKNPAHGQPGHRCDIAVGSPLPK